MKPISDIAGVILSAGASTRMGRPKAMLRFPDGVTLLARQFELLHDAGCAGVFVVVGASAADIRAAHMDLDAHWVVNDAWETGQFSSIQAGLSEAALASSDGILLLPVDVACVAAATIEAIVETALRNPHLDAVVPEHDGRGGHPVALSTRFAEKLLELDPASPQARLDRILAGTKNLVRLPVSDPRVAANVNTPAEWEALMGGGPR